MRDTTHKITNDRLQNSLNKLCSTWLDEMDDPVVVAQATGWLLDVLQTDVLIGVSAYRIRAVRQLRIQGFTLAEIAAELGLSRARVDAIAKT